MIDYSTKKLDEIVPEYNSRCWFVRKIFWQRFQAALEFADIKNNMRILDVGCGAGHLLRAIRTKNKKCTLYGTDININIRKVEIPKCKIKIADARVLPFSNNFFDIIFAADVLEHIKNTDKAIKEIRRVLKRDGQLIVIGPTETAFYRFCRLLLKGTTSPMIVGHYYDIDQLEKLLEANGFSIIKRKNLPAFSPLPLQRIFKLKIV